MLGNCYQAAEGTTSQGTDEAVDRTVREASEPVEIMKDPTPTVLDIVPEGKVDPVRFQYQ